mmetsp:Transcript_598/g.1230  ORF Transcript_598/g.1230 Transcript_598/m.1230 type:complete len:507 (+) Transcript_598:33-1553(+)
MSQTHTRDKSASRDNLQSSLSSQLHNLSLSSPNTTMNSSTSNIIGDRDPSHVKSLDKSKLNDKHGDDNADADPPSDSKAAVSTDKAKRFLPAYKKANAALTFPEKMMNLMKYVDEKNKTEKDFCISWLPEGKAFVIYNIKEFTSSVIPKFFKASKFCSFTRKLYRWGFRQLNRGIGPDEPIIFGNEYFQRDNADLMVNMRSITAASIRKRESDLLRHMLASKKRSLLSDPTGGDVSHQDTKQYNMAAQFDQKQNASRVANVLASQQRFGGGSGAADGCYSTNLSHLNNQELQMMYQSIVDPTRKSGNGADGGIVPIISDAMSQMSNPYSNFGSGGSSHQQDFNAMTSMHMGNNSSGSSSMMAGPTSNFISSQTGNNSSFDSVSGNGTNSRMNNMGNSYGNNGMGFNSAFNNNIFSSADSMYGNNSSRGGGNFNLSQQFSNSGTNCDIGNSRKNLMNHGGKHNYDNGNYSNFNNTPMNMNINQQLFNLSSSTAPGAGSEDLYFSGQY